jgi:hypothetical protein
MALGQAIFMINEAKLSLLQWVWQEMYYQLEFCRTQRADTYSTSEVGTKIWRASLSICR